MKFGFKLLPLVCVVLMFVSLTSQTENRKVNENSSEKLVNKNEHYFTSRMKITGKCGSCDALQLEAVRRASRSLL